MSKKIEKASLKKSFLRTFIYGASWNYERMQNLGFLYTIKPVLKDLYGNNKAELKKAVNRHLEFFNTQQSLAPFIIGITSAFEEKDMDNKDETINGIKVGLMGPLAGLGDSLIWLTLIPIAMSLGATYSSKGSPLGMILALLLFNVINIAFKFYGMRYGYKKGSDFVENASKEKINNVTQLAISAGLILVGGLIAQMVNVKLGLTFKDKDLVISVQEILDNIFPKLLPLLTTLGVYKLLRKGKNPQIIILAIIVLSIILTGLGILA